MTYDGVEYQRHSCSNYHKKCVCFRHPQVARQLHLHRGVLPVHYYLDREEDWMKDVDNRIQVRVLSVFNPCLIFFVLRLETLGQVELIVITN